MNKYEIRKNSLCSIQAQRGRLTYIFFFTLIFLFSASILRAQNSPSKVLLDSGLVAYYPFENDAMDYSGNGNVASVHGARLIKKHSGLPRSACVFEHPHDTIVVPGSSDLDFSEKRAFTLSMWVCGLGHNGEASIKVTCCGGGGGTGCKLFGVYISVSDQTVTADVHSSECHIKVHGLFQGNLMRCHMLTCTIDDEYLVLYHDGRFVDKRSLYETKWETNSTTVLSIITSPYPQFHPTTVDDVRVYGRALTAEEILSLYETER